MTQVIELVDKECWNSYHKYFLYIEEDREKCENDMEDTERDSNITSRNGGKNPSISEIKTRLDD